MHLSSVERLSLESSARKYTSPYCDVIRAKIILLADQGLPNDKCIGQFTLQHADPRELAYDPMIFGNDIRFHWSHLQVVLGYYRKFAISLAS
jgi:hypothetical protein